MVHFEADAKDKAGNPVHVVADGKLENIGSYNRTITGTWTEGDAKGDFKITQRLSACRDFSRLAAGWWGSLTIAATCFASGDAARARQDDERRERLFLDACTACHTLERVRVQRLGKEEWRHLIAGMLSEGVPLNDEETSCWSDYLARNFGPENP